MSAGIMGTHPQKTNDSNPQLSGNGPLSTSEGTHQELTPDRPPQPVEDGAGGSASEGTDDGGTEGKPKRPRGFAAMDRKLVSEIARKGGKAAHSAGTAHEFTSEEARVAGRKGGRATHAKRRKAVEGHEEPKPHEEKPGE
jgi:uncharacterized protein